MNGPDRTVRTNTYDESRRLAKAERLKREIAISEQSQELLAVESLRMAKAKGTIMGGVVSALREIELSDVTGEGMDREVFLVVMLQERWPVLIPYREVFRSNPVDMSTVDLTTKAGREKYLRRQTSMLQKLFGAKIQFVITQLEYDDELDDLSVMIAGSRRLALEKLEQRYFAPNPKTGEARISEQDIVPAEIVSVGPRAVFVCIHGIEMSMNARTLTWRYTTDLQQYYSPGQFVFVKIKEIKQREDGTRELTISGRSVELINARAKAALVPPRTRAIATITSVYVKKTEGRPTTIRIIAYMDAFGMPVTITEMPQSSLAHSPKIGDKIRITVQRVDESGMTFAVCDGFHGSSGFINR